ncbi:hypothetical protein [Streptomyces sp. NPDC056049]|uniref:hypothetical protein n=1 Tax=Streptomyces sp. NPDC056049 TaxID=3345693 RepID=UPI0035DF4BCB
MTARPPRPAPAVGAEKVVAEGVRSGSGPRPAGGLRTVGFLRIVAPARRGGEPRAEWFCSCGRYETVRGESRVHALIAAHDAHRAACPLLSDGRSAA